MWTIDVLYILSQGEPFIVRMYWALARKHSDLSAGQGHTQFIYTDLHD